MATTRKPAVSSAAAPVKPVVPVKPSAKLAAAGKKPAGKPKAKAKARPEAAARAKPKAPAPEAAKVQKVKKPKLVRDSFTMPKTEYAVLDALKARAQKAGRPAKKSELLRAGIRALAALPDLAFVSALGAVPALKSGRPPKA